MTGRELTGLKARELLGELYEHAAVGIEQVAPDGRLLMVNSALCQMLGYSRSELLDKSFEEILPPDDRGSGNKLLKQMLAGEHKWYASEQRYVRRNGSLVWAAISSSPVRDKAGSTSYCIYIVRDITDSKLAASIADLRERQRALSESEDKLALLLESTAEGIFGIDLEARCTFCNPAGLRMLGYKRADELIGKNMHDLIHHTRLDGTPYPVAECPILSALQGGEGAHIQDEILWKADGTSFHAEYWSSPQRRDGQVIGAVIAFVDITARKQIQEALKKSEEKFSKAFRAGPMSLSLTNAKTDRLVEVNDTFERLTGYSREEALGRTTVDLGLWVDTSQRVKFFKRLLAEGNLRQEEAAYRRKDGSIRVGLGSAELIEVGGEQLILSAIIDITESKQALSALRQSEEKFRRIFDDAPSGMVMLSPEGRFLAVNRAFCEFLGYSEQELIGKDIVFVTHPEDQTISWQAMDQALAGDSGPRRFEKRYLDRNGQLMWGELSTFLLRDSEGKPEYFVSHIVNITERKRMEEELRQREAELRKAQHLAQVGSWLWDLRSNVVTWSEELYRIHGRDPSLPAPSPKELSQLFVAEDSSRLSAAMAKARLTGEVEDLDLELIRPDGSKRWVAVCGEAVRDGSGSVVQLRGTVQDITERKQAEERMREYERAVEGAEEMIAVIDREYRYVIANHAFVNQLKVTKEQILGRPISEFKSKEVFETVVKNKLDESFKGNVVRYEMRHAYPERGERDLFVSYFPIEGPDGVHRVAVVLQDITERKRAEQELRESEERFRLVANAAPVMIWMSGTDKLCNYFNQPWLEFTGRPLEAELGNGWAEGVHPDDLQKCLEMYTQSFDGRIPFRVEYRLRRHDGEYRWIEDTGVPRLNPDGSFAGYIGSCVDIAERKRAEEALHSVSGKLIEAQERERSRIARELHDDINQRLAMVAVELQQLKDVPLLSVVQLRGRTGELFKQITEISSDLQLLSHRLHSSSLDYLGLVPAMKGFCQEFAKHQKVDVDFVDSNVPSHLPSDTALGLFRILQEALHNAAKHSGVRQFEVRLAGVPGGVQLTVRDSGKGFDAKSAFTGQSLGLVSMRERTNLLNGTISIASKPNAGTEVKVLIPLAREMDASFNASA